MSSYEQPYSFLSSSTCTLRQFSSDLERETAMKREFTRFSCFLEIPSFEKTPLSQVLVRDPFEIHSGCLVHSGNEHEPVKLR